VVATALIPRVVGNDTYAAHVINTAMIYAALALSLDLIIGFAGQMSFSHAAFYGIGAYTAGILATRFHLAFWGTLPAALCVTGLTGLAVGLPVLRLRGAFLAIATMGVQLIVGTVLLKWVGLTRGPAGIFGIPAPRLFGATIEGPQAYYYVVAGWLLLHLLLLYRIRVSRMGYELLAIREDEDAARAMGTDATRLKLLAFVVGTALAGGTGAVYAHYLHSIDPSPFDMNLSATLLVMVLLGGRGMIWGGLLGAFLLTLLPEWMRFLLEFRIMIYGAIMILLVMFMPRGLLGLVTSAAARLQAREGVEPRGAPAS